VLKVKLTMSREARMKDNHRFDVIYGECAGECAARAPYMPAGTLNTQQLATYEHEGLEEARARSRPTLAPPPCSKDTMIDAVRAKAAAIVENGHVHATPPPLLERCDHTQGAHKPPTRSGRKYATRSAQHTATIESSDDNE
jgi:hypothetical protein